MKHNQEDVFGRLQKHQGINADLQDTIYKTDGSFMIGTPSKKTVKFNEKIRSHNFGNDVTSPTATIQRENSQNFDKFMP